ncbi:hypothetical protein JF634_04295 [Simonsiella muelleri]|uniref:Uncharacterized protein n=1 Tax=Simonsiella muelleri ATCC 29453 TaxID=641147 RepID=V9H9R7_9NEIS|nr:hypothetical protein [Simonsiella muelleri]AUX60467.1 hypothetical protein BWP33_00535 [Simonsiella muelleri ATCC 29453]EFG32009.1 hypothetical protein HMPREF9021_00414 [Simonsiella muelleri ATCC 29453]UBQ54709.1 hypothetical protein JF634_04295 [Simonsiella muelleri]
MWLNKILWILLALALLIFAFRALLNRQQKQAVHQTVAFIAKVILIVASISALWTFFHRYF